MFRSKVFLGISLVAILSIFAAQSMSQDEPQRGPRGPRQGQEGGRRGEGGGFGQGKESRDPEQMRQMMQQRMMERMKQQLNASDEEWKKIEAPLTKVMKLSQDVGGMGMMFGRGPRPEEGAEESKLEKARRDLGEALRGEEADKDAINEKLAAFRQARDETKKELAAAQKELKSAVSPQQEAHLVMMGMLE